MQRPDEKHALAEMLSAYGQICRQDLDAWLIEPNTPAELAEAMRYCTAGGKRLRASLVLLASQAGKGIDQTARRAAVAIECLHAYSLVHDDLPAMDDDTLRRGQPTAHVKFGEALAILAGDALLTRAMGLLAEADSEHAAQLVAILASASGATGMIAGQVADMELTTVSDDLAGVEYIHHRKTAALIQAATHMGAICGQCDQAEIDGLKRYGHHVGMAFQIIDDLLDVTGQADQLGKTPGKDASAGKHTTVAVLGLEKARTRARAETRLAVDALAVMGDRAKILASLAEHLAQRSY